MISKRTPRRSKTQWVLCSLAVLSVVILVNRSLADDVSDQHRYTAKEFTDCGFTKAFEDQQFDPKTPLGKLLLQAYLFVSGREEG